MKMRTFLLVLLAVAIFALPSSPVFAQSLQDPSGSFTGLLDLVRNSANNWHDQLHGYAVRIFWMLALIQFIWTFFPLVFRQADLGEIVGELIRFILIIGFFAALLDNSVTWASAIIDSFRQAGASAAGLGDSSLRPGAMFDVAVELANTIGNVETWNPLTAMMVALAGCVVLLCFAFIAAFMALTIIESYVVINASVLFMGLGASQWTREYAIAMLRYALSVGAKLFVLTLIVGIVMTSATTWQAAYNHDDASMWTMIGLAFACAYLAKTIPDLIQGLITGTSYGGGGALGGMAAAGAAGAAAAVAAVATGGAAAPAAAGALASGTGAGAGGAAAGGLGASISSSLAAGQASGAAAGGLGAAGSGAGATAAGSGAGNATAAAMPRVAGGGAASPVTGSASSSSTATGAGQSTQATAAGGQGGTATGNAAAAAEGQDAQPNLSQLQPEQGDDSGQQQAGPATPPSSTGDDRDEGSAIGRMAAAASVRGTGILSAISVPGMEGAAGISLGPDAGSSAPLSDSQGSGSSDFEVQGGDNIIQPAADSAAPTPSPAPASTPDPAASTPRIDTLSSLQDALRNKGGTP